jgi:hypothetical protein
MEKEDARYQTLEQLHERRKQVVRLHKKGIKVMQIVALSGLSHPTVRATIDPKSGSYPANSRRSGGSHGGSGRVIFATT